MAARKSAVPATLKDAGPHDRMLWQWKLEGKSYMVIAVEWEKLTGEKHNDGFFSTRFEKLKQKFAENNALDVSACLRTTRIPAIARYNTLAASR